MKTKGWIGCDFIANKEHKQQTDIDDDDVFEGQEEEEG